MKIEEYKKQLSYEKDVEILSDELFYDGKEINMTITRSEYENECEEIFQKCFESIDKVLELAKLKKEDINEIALSGGSSRTPRIREMIKEYFNKEPLKTINPDEAIAYGATIVACIESGTEIEDKELLELKDLKIIDITSCSIGIELAGGKMEVIIPKGEKLPENGKTRIFRKICKPEFNCGNECILSLFEGENKLVKFNYKLGEYRFRLLEKNEKTMKIIKILFKLTSDSIITIIVEENEEKLIEVKSSEIYPNEILIRFVKHIYMFEQLEKETKKKQQLKKTFNRVLKELNKIFESYKLDNENIKKDIETTINQFTQWYKNNKDSKISEYNKKIEEIKELIEKIKLLKIQTPKDNFY